MLIIYTIFILCLPTKTGMSYACFFPGASIHWLEHIKNKIFSITLLLAGIYLAGYKELNYWYFWLNELLYIDLPSGKNTTYYFVPMISGFILVLVSVKSSILKYVIESDFSVLLGRLSFSAYLIQIPVLYTITPLLKISIEKLNISYDAVALLFIITSIFTVYAISFIFMKYIDEKSIKLSISVADHFISNTKENVKEKISL